VSGISATSQKGQRFPTAVYVTRPESAKQSKEGMTGTQVTLSANYFELTRKPDFAFTQYRVDFEPDCDDIKLRKFLVGTQRATFGGFLYDGGSLLYLTRRLPQDEMTFNITTPRDNRKFILKIKHTGNVISMTDSMATNVLNVILRRTMDKLNMQLVGRNLYDPGSRVSFDFIT
jgi:aubergine